MKQVPVYSAMRRFVNPLLSAGVLVVAACGSERVTSLPSADVVRAAEAWVSQNAHALASTELSNNEADFAALGPVAANARIVGMGEASHGTHELFTLKGRVFQYLVRQQGFNAIAVEATMPEAFRLDRYVRTGAGGDPVVLLSHLHFWTIDTQEVLDLIAWMRQYNSSRPPSAQIGFYGVDMQYPGDAIDSVQSYVARAMPSLSATIASDYACLVPYRNDSSGVFKSHYDAAGTSVWTACTPRVLDVRAKLTSNASALQAMSSIDDYSMAVQMATIVEQFEAYARGPGDRDRDMSDNAQWLLGRLGPNGRLFLWAHNAHIGREYQYKSTTRSMGGYLDDALHSAYRPIETLFATGRINAVRQAEQNGKLVSTGAGVIAMDAGSPTEGSAEQALSTSLSAAALIDLRAVPSGDARAWFSAPVPRRSIGAIFVPEHPDDFFAPQSMSTDFDALIYVPTVSPSVILKTIAPAGSP